MTGGIRIRLAGAADAPGIAMVHVESRRAAYRGLVPDDVLGAQTVEARERLWASRFEAPSDWFCFVAEQEGAMEGEGGAAPILGFASGGAERRGEPGVDGELHSIYVSPSSFRRGLGRRLFRAVMDELRARGYRSMLVWVLEENGRARRFYEVMGGRAVASGSHEIGGRSYGKVGYAWADLGSGVAAR